ncbi:MAG TPA: hypothetical protein VMD03_06115 [Steroidobacteraceae bacterium]|nr:hypothetical protein [Steroidobacteraceae bacterium]
MNESVGVAAVEATGAPLAGRELKSMLTLIRREFWEQRILWMAPLCVAALLVLGAVFGRTQFNHTMMPSVGMTLTPQMTRAVFAVSVLTVGLAEYLTMSLVLWYYAADCLYAERRDRSILFWKSMPVSDGETVLSKVLVAMVIVPLGVYLVTAATTVVTSAIWSLRAWGGSAGPVFWDTSTWLRLEGVTFITTIVASLWYAPVTAYLMLVSVLARRNAQLWVFLPPIVGILIERLAFGTHYLFTVIIYRLQGGWQAGIVRYVTRLFTGPAEGPDAASLSPAPNPFELIHPTAVFANIDLWIGLVVAVAMLFAAARIRRYRDEA